MLTSQKRLDIILTTGQTPASVRYNVLMALLVGVVCVDFVVASYSVSQDVEWWMNQIDTTITIVFLVDYLLRWWAKQCAIAYLFTPMALVDLVAVLPLFIAETHLQFVRVLRLFRILRLLHLFKNKAFFGKRMTETHFRLLQIFFTLFCIVFISSGLIYDVEHDHNPKVMGTFFDAVYFTVVSLSTVGYGDIVPLSTAGRVVTLLMIVSGAILIPLQLTSLVRYLIYRGGKSRLDCRGCGLGLHEHDAAFCKGCGTALYLGEHQK